MAPKTKNEEISQMLRLHNVSSRLLGFPDLHITKMGELGRQQHETIMAAASALDRAAAVYPVNSARHSRLSGLAHEITADRDLNPYTFQMYNEDERAQYVNMQIRYGYNPQGLTFDDPKEVEADIVRYFRPFDWPEFRGVALFGIFREIVPAMTVARATQEVYENQRWLYDETAQRAAEVLSYRLQYGDLQEGLPPVIPTDSVQATVAEAVGFFEVVVQKLLAGVDVRRWLRGKHSK